MMSEAYGLMSGMATMFPFEERMISFSSRRGKRPRLTDYTDRLLGPIGGGPRDEYLREYMESREDIWVTIKRENRCAANPSVFWINFLACRLRGE
tara:strand:- start:199 stop:483 length:285 start_codon:yes stop_codon:yes gene_type:complete